MNDKLKQQWLSPIILILIIVTLQICNSLVSATMEFDRFAIQQGEWWRILSGHLLHANNWHLAMNVAAFAVILDVQGMHLNFARFTVLLFAGCLLIGLEMFFLSPSMIIYTGLSGWLHCLIVWGACADIVKHWSSGWLILIGVFCKVTWEQIHGGSADVVALIGVDVAVDAHLYGALTGLLLFFVMQSIPPLAVVRASKAA